MVDQYSANPDRTCFSTTTPISKTSDVTEVLSDADLPGNDINPEPLRGTTFYGCGVECGVRGTGCKAWTWVPPTVGGALAECWLKHTLPSGLPVLRPGMVSGRKKYLTVGGIPI